jgi:Tol biopolymer transport system component
MVMDFGVAKAVSEATGRNTLTTAGVALGTPTYMAPEQATADPNVDHRADIYAVGVMAYELLAGRTPFQGASPQAVLAAHVTEQAEPVSKHRDHVSGDLEALVMKCLAKRPADRWQSADEMLPHLEAMATTSGGLTPTSTRPIQGVAAPRRRVWWMAAGAAAAVIVIAVFGATILRDEPLTITTSNMRQLTFDPGLELQPRLSPDGNEIVYLATRGVDLLPGGILFRTVAGGDAFEVAPDFPGSFRSAQWAQDGQAIKFRGCPPNQPCGAYQVPKLGGAVTTISRDSFVSNGGSATVVFRDSGAFIVSPELDAPIGLSRWADPHSPAWSPDGRRLAFVDRNSLWRAVGNEAPSAIWLLDLDVGEPVQITTAEHLNVSPAWMADSRHLLFVSDRDGTRGVYILEVGRSGAVGEPRLIPGIVDPHSIVVASDGTRLAYSRFSQVANVWSVPMPGPGAVSRSEWIQETIGRQKIELYDVNSSGDSLLFDSGRSGNMDIFKSGRGDANPVQLTTDPANDYGPAWSHDGREVAFYSLRTGFREIFVTSSAPGGRPVRLTEHGTDARFPAWAPDGLAIAYRLLPGRRLAVVRRDSVGGTWSAPQVFADLECNVPDFSPSGETIVCLEVVSGDVEVVDLAGNVLWQWPAEAGEFTFFTAFLPDGDVIVVRTFVDRERGFELWRVSPTPGAEPSLLLRDRRYAGTWLCCRVTADMIFMTRPELEADIWVADLEY